MINARDIYSFSSTALAAYGTLDVTKNSLEKNLLQGVDNDSLFSKNQAKEFSNEWHVVTNGHMPDQPGGRPENGGYVIPGTDTTTGGGFSATLFQRNTGDKDYVLAFRGTMGMDDLAVTDGGDIVLDGVASSQIIDMYNFWMALKTPVGQTFSKAVVVSASPEETLAFNMLGSVAGMAAANAAGYYWDSGKAYKIIRDDTNVGTGVGAFSEGAKLTVTGHSLGGHLAAAFTRLFPETKAEALTINAAGFGAPQTKNVDTFFDLLGGTQTSFDKDKITNLYGDKNPNFITQDFLLSQKGAHLPIWIEQSPISEETWGHGSGQMVQSAALYDLFFRLDKSLQSISLKELIGKVTPIIEAVSNKRINTFESVIDTVGAILGLPELAKAQLNDREIFYNALFKLEKSSTFSTLAGKVKIGVSPFNLDSLARTDFSAFISLFTLSPITLTGVNADGQSKLINQLKLVWQTEFTQWQADAGKADSDRVFTDAYLHDRAEMLSWVVQGNLTDASSTDNDMSITSIQAGIKSDLHFYDAASGEKVSVTINGGLYQDQYNDSRARELHSVSFGSSGSDSLTGQKQYGGDGDDILQGSATENYLEGGNGSDTYKLVSSGLATVRDIDGNGVIQYEGKTISGKFSCSTASHLIYYTDDNNCRLINTADGKWDLAIKASDATTFTTIAHLDGWNDGELGINLAVKSDGQFSEVNFKNSSYYIAIDAGSAPGDTYLYGGSKEDSIKGSNYKDIINTGDGNSYVLSYTGNDFITCGNGNDFVMSGPGADSSNDNDVVSGGTGTNIIYSGGGDDVLYAIDKDADFESESSSSGSKGDWLTAGSGSDLLFGSDSQDVLLGGGNDDIIRGGAGNDLIFGDASAFPAAQAGTGPSGTAGWISKAWSAQDNGFIDANKSLFGLTILTGQTFSWQWTVLDSGDVSVSYFGYTPFANGRFSQNSGDDVLDGGNGNDWIAGQAGNDTLYGGDGDDILYGDDAIALGFNAIDGNDKIHAGAGKDKLFGCGGNDILWATEDDQVVDILQGGEGNDSLFGGTGADQLDGGAGDDDLHAGSDGSSLIGGAGADLLIGGAGSDKLDGGAGSDYFVTSAGSDSLIDAEGNDYYQINSKDFVAASAKTVISDGDGKGLLHLDNDVIEGKALTATSKTTWKANSGAYTLELKAGSLFISMKDAAGSVEIKNFVNSKDGYLGLVLPEYSEQPDPQVNHAPVLAAPLPNKTAKEDKAFKFVLPVGTFTDSDSGDSLSLSATLSNGKALPTWLKFNAKTRTFSGTPDNDQVGAIAIRVTATDKAGAKASDVFKITVQNINDAPEVATALPEKQDAKEGALFEYVAPLNEVFKDVDKGDVLTYSSTLADGSALPAWLQFDTATGTFSGTPVVGSAGQLGLVVTATDKAGASVSNGFSLNIAATINVLKGTSANDTLKGSEGQDKIYGYDGDDTLYGRGGDDALSGSNGNDRLDGGAGNDTLSGGAGNDTYYFGKGYGQDLISDTDATVNNQDRLLFKSGIATDQLWFKNSNNNLEVSIIGTSDTVTIKNWFTNSNAHVEQFKTADGKTLLDSQVANLVSAMATLTPPAAGETSLSTAYHNKLDVVIAANWK